MKYIVIDSPRNGVGDEWTKEYNMLGEAVGAAKSQWDYLTGMEKKQRYVFVLESINPDEDAENHFDGDVVWTSDQKYEVDIKNAAGVISPIDTIIAPTGYTAEDYTNDCERNADDEWNEMLANGDIILLEIG